MTAEVFTPSDVNVTMTPTAVKHVRKQLDKKPEAKGIRLAIKKSGCSGFKYETQWVETPESDDRIFTIDGVDVFDVTKVRVQRVRGARRCGAGRLRARANGSAVIACGQRFNYK
mgnify:CR=1 FL=1